MTFKIVSNSGSGSVVDESVISYSYSEDVSSLEPTTSDGGTGQFNFSAVEVLTDPVTGSKLSNSKFLINNTVQINDSDRGSVTFQVKKVSTNAGVANVVGDTVQARLNVEKTAKPFFAAGKTHSWAGVANNSNSIEVDSATDTTRINLVKNPSLENNALWSTSSNGTEVATVFTGTGMPSGSKCLNVQLTSTSAFAVYPQGRAEVTAGLDYTASVYVYRLTSVGNGEFKIYFYWHDINGNLLTVTSPTATVVPVTAWTRIFRTETAPAEAVNVTVRIGNTNPSAITGTIRFDAAMLEQSSVLNDYFDGSTATIPDPVKNGMLDTALKYYASLCDVTAVIDSSLSIAASTPVNFMGWTGNVWEQLKMLCASVSASTTDNVGMEMFVDNDTLKFRAANTSTITFNERESEFSESIDVFEAGKQVEVYNYNTSYGVNKIVYDQKNYAEDADQAKIFLASISDSFSVDAGATVSKKFKIDATLAAVNQPTCVSTISSVPYTGTTGEYVIVGNDELPIMPEQWIAQGGSLTVKLTDVPDEIEVTVVAPQDEKILSTSAGTFTFAPYKIGVETSGDGIEYPALWITGSGVFFNKKKETFETGSDSVITAREVAKTIDTVFITNNRDFSRAALASAQAICGPKITVTASADTLFPFGTTPGSTFTRNDSKFRVTSTSYAYDTTNMDAERFVTFADFDALWTGKTFTNFDTMAVSGSSNLAFNEFSVAPLMIG